MALQKEGGIVHKPKVFIVEDEKHICELIKTYLTEEFDVLSAHDGEQALAIYRKGRFDLLILDIMLPGMSGWDICRQVRQIDNTPIIMLTAKDDEFDKILGLELGADDYVTKPFNPRELLARVKAVLRRFKGGREENLDIIEHPGITVNKVTRQVNVNGEDLDVTPKEFDLLWLFVSNPGMVFNREHIIQKVWGYDYIGETRAIDNTIKRLRRKLEAVPGAPMFIHTVWGVGYKFEVTS